MTQDYLKWKPIFVKILEEELDMWYLGILKKDWQKHYKKIKKGLRKNTALRLTDIVCITDQFWSASWQDYTIW